MLEANTGSIMLEAGLSSASSKRNPFDLITSIFSKKKPSAPDTEEPTTEEEFENNDGSGSSDHRYSASPMVSNTPAVVERPVAICNTPLPKSPISIKNKSLKQDVEALHLSRQDNPYLQQLEKLSIQEENMLSSEFSLSSIGDGSILPKEWQSKNDGEVADLHQHLVRSPPPQFPQNVSHFMYSRANSPKHQQNKDLPDSPSLQSVDKEGRKSKILNPILSKSGVDVLDPGVREVLEFQKQQLVADSRCSLSSGPIEFNRSSPSSEISATPSHLHPIATKSQSRWSNGASSKSYQVGVSPVPNATGSLPGLTSSCLGLFSSTDADSKNAPLRPVRVGRAQSDGVVIGSSSVQDLLISPSPNSMAKNRTQTFSYLFSAYASKTGSQEPLLNASSKASSLDVG